jgi:hypothetical protein
MRFKIKSSLVLFIVLSAVIITSSCGSCESRKTDSKISPKEYLPLAEKEDVKPDFSLAIELNDPLLFMRLLTGYSNIGRVYGVLNLVEFYELLKRVESGEADTTTGRRYFVYSPPHRRVPISMSHRRLDIEAAVALAARNIGKELIRSNDIERATFSISMIARRMEAVIMYAIDEGSGNHAYGIYYLLSAIPLTIKDSNTRVIIVDDEAMGFMQTGNDLP